MGTAEFVVGALLRREFRRLLRSRGLGYSEDKGWLDSQFIVEGERQELFKLGQLARRVDSVCD